jgi:hypothetical protein
LRLKRWYTEWREKEKGDGKIPFKEGRNGLSMKKIFHKEEEEKEKGK